MGLVSFMHDDPHRAAMAARLLPPSGVTIGVSRSGSTLDTAHFLKTAREAGAFTIALTLSRRPITQYTDCVLNTANLEAPLEIGSLASKISQMVVLNALLLLLTVQYPGTHDFIRLTAATVAEKNY